MIIPKIKYVFDRQKRAKNKVDRTGKIELRISYDGKDKYISTGIGVQPEKWNDNEQMVAGMLEAMSYNLILARLRAKVMEVISDMEKEGSFDLNAIPDRLKAQSVNLTFLEFVELRIMQEEKTKAYNTVKGHKVFLRQMTAWGKIKYFGDITQANINKMNEWLKGRGLLDETIYGYNKHLRQFINDAIIEGHIKENPYSAKGIKLKHGAPNVHNYVTEEELKKIMKVSLSTERLRKVRDLFVFQAFTGMAYADIMSFDFTKAVKRKGNMYVLDGRRTKTDIPYHFVLLDKAVDILERYNWRLPHISNQKYNDVLKTIAEKCEIDKPIASHWARRTAGMIMLNNGVPVGVVSRILGHASTRTTEKAYAFLLDNTIDDAMIGFEKRMKKRGMK